MFRMLPFLRGNVVTPNFLMLLSATVVIIRMLPPEETKNVTIEENTGGTQAT